MNNHSEQSRAGIVSSVAHRKKVSVQEVGPRDGFQNLSEFIETSEKIKYIEGLIDAGVQDIQITSFVNPKAIPQMKDAKEVALYCTEKYPQLHPKQCFFALVPNLRGAVTAIECGIKKLSFVISLSVSHNQANLKKTHEESLQELGNILTQLSSVQMFSICVDIATAFGCPFEGIPQEGVLLSFIEKIYAMGIREFCLCDTVGLATPNVVREQIRAVRETFNDITLGVHIHDTRGMGLVNTLAAIEEEADFVQSALGGLGGCPFAPGASGNTSSEDLVYMLENMGYDTGIDITKLTALAKNLQANVQGSYSGHLIHIDSLCTVSQA